MKILSFTCLIFLSFTYQVKYENKCSDCSQLKSQRDCEQQQSINGNCEWIIAQGSTAAKCQLVNKVNQKYTPYCELVDKPEINCAKTLGCAYVDSKCTHFTGCQAYVKTTTTDCQAISNFCVSDGNACIETKVCKAYTLQQCESTPSISGILKCKQDTTAGNCRDYTCVEANATLNTDEKCSSWLAGCVTNGQGCVNAPKPACSTYTEKGAACYFLIGSDGYCELAAGNTKCIAKQCTNAPKSLSTDNDCQIYQIGCITTGKGCIFATSKPLCSTYFGDNTTCVGYIGSDGVCEGDAGGTKCRLRKCEIWTYNTDELCKQNQSNCITNGKTCVSALSACDTYKGTATTCAVYIGTDGYCKGTSATNEASCSPKVCDEAPDTTTTDDACAKYQVGCVTTGKGCVTKANLKSCTTYDGDTTSCQSRVGTEGKCTWKSGTKCVARDCASAASNVNTNPLCANYFTNCVTTGSGCVSQTTCDLTVKQQSCEGTNNCSWQPICTSNTQCSDYKKKSICLANQARIKTQDGVDDQGNPKYIYVTGKCGWLNNACKDLACSDLTGAYYNTDANCAAELSTCISNRVDACITKYDCSKLLGTQSTCLSYPGYCTNESTATDTTPCVSRKCADNTDATDNSTCATFLSGCISNGKGCVDYNTPCTSMKGTQDTCIKLFAYKSGSADNFTTNQCYNSASATDGDYCQVKTCKSAENQNENTCESFLDGCVYNGNGGCVDPQAEDTICQSYTGVEAFCESAIIRNNSKKYCFGTSTLGTCKTRECTDNTTATKDEDCEAFMSGCIAKFEGGCIAKSARSCSQQNGNVDTCSNLSGGLLVSSEWIKIGCTQYDICQNRQCADLANPYSDLDCTSYKSTCRFFKLGFPCLDAAVCAAYITPDTAITDQQKFDYCTTIKDRNGLFCGWVQGTTCAVRTCDQFLSTYSTSLTCFTYLQKGISSATADTCKLAGTFCYLPEREACDYPFPIGMDTDVKKLAQCQKYVNQFGVVCSFKPGDATCTYQDECEKLVSQTSAQACNDVLGYFNGICQKVSNTGCLSTVASCGSYNLDSSLSDANKKTACESLKVVNDVAKFGLGTATYTGCTWSTGNTCTAFTCATISSATSQKDCDSKTVGCYYYSGKCYAPVFTCPSSFPADLDTDTKKALYCKSMFKLADSFCEIKRDGTGCQTGSVTACASVAIAVSWTLANFDGATKTTDAFCITQSIKDKSRYCIKDDATKCKDGVCENIPNPISQNDCDIHLLGCVFFASKCRTPFGVVSVAGDCANLAKVPFSDVASLTASAKTAYCQIFSKDGASVFCTYDEFHVVLQTACVAAEACDSYTSLPANDSTRLPYCLSKINSSGKKCGFTTGATRCRDFDCQDIQSPTSQVDCDLQANGLKCVYYRGTCVNDDNTCVQILAIGKTSNDKRSYCANLSVIDICTYVTGANCVKENACNTYDVTDATDKVAACRALNDGMNRCTYIFGNNCVTLAQCYQYDGTTVVTFGPAAGSEEEQCKAVKSTEGYPCMKDTHKKCKAQACTDNDGSATDCANNAPGCLYYENKCITKDICAAYTPQGADDAAKQTWCEGVLNSFGELCAWHSESKKCKDRMCSDKSFQTDFDCRSYLKSCKTNGNICVNSSTDCNLNKGSSDFCNSLLDATGKDRCRLSAATSIQQQCTNKQCYDNVTATSDSECNSYMNGCVTRGRGCIPNTEQCTSYRGTKMQCEQFKRYTGLDANKNPIYEYCSGDATNTAIGKCKVRTCADNTIATSDTDCAAYLKGCITKGTGCIDATSSCTGFKGDQATCAKFMGSSGKDYCWNTSAALATATCAKKKCSDIAGKNNKDCNDGMPPFKTTDDPFCVFDETGCIDYGKNCSTFNGTEETCPTYLAKDGPCKATTVGTIKGACAKRVCTEAPNTLATDADCQKYHKDCYTTGQGCATNNLCSNIINKQQCQVKPECSWVKYCTAQIIKCESLNSTSYSQCANSKVNGKFCHWNEQDSTCRSQTCEDQPATYDSHAQCQHFADNCTTTGAGCITISTCTAYIKRSICNAASYSKDGLKRCIWDSILKSCRSQECSDISAQINADCDAFGEGCKLNGQRCVLGLSCTEFTNQLFCISSKNGPCLWIYDQCYDYKRCEDAGKKTHFECQAFSQKCTTNGDTCIPITNCASTTLKASCVVGTDGACGWLPTGKCQKFGQCTDAVAATNDECLSYGPTCITDGTACIAKAACATYKTQTACNNLGTDGICYWNATANTCKLKECGDEQKGTNDQCKLISVTGGSCTTDGTKCIPLAVCSSYVEAGCFYGTNGECIFAIPIGATTGRKTCRQKQCEDITAGTSNDNCMGVITGKACVSNGSSCIAKAACSTYKTITSCNGGGLENNKSTVCAFTPTGTDKVNGTCKTFTACADAVKDKFACAKNPSCLWIEDSTGASCINHTCETYATEAGCLNIPTFDGNSQTVCFLQNGKCVSSDPIEITDPRICYSKSYYTHTWNILTSKCESCIQIKNPNTSQTTDSVNFIFFLSLCLWVVLVLI